MLWCSNIPLSTDYSALHDIVKIYGHVPRIELHLHKDKSSFNAYVTFFSSQSAYEANSNLNNSLCSARKLTTKILKVANVGMMILILSPKMILMKIAI